MTDIPEGYGLIAGRGQETARAALDAAEEAGVDINEVRTTDGGYLVPEKVLKQYEKGLKKKSEPEDDTEDDSEPKKKPAKKPAEKKS